MLDLLEWALALEKHRNYRRRLYWGSQPTVTRAIQELERLFSVPLFDRIKPRLRPDRLRCAGA